MSLPVYYGLVVTPVIFSFISIFIDSVVKREEITFLDELLWVEPQSWEWAVYGMTAIILMMALVGLLWRKEWGRKLFIYTYLPSFLLYLMPSVQWVYMSKFSSLFYDIANMVLGMLFLVLLIPSLYQPIFNKTERNELHK